MQATTWGTRDAASAYTPRRPWATYLLMLALIGAMYGEVMAIHLGYDPNALFQKYGLVSSSFSWTDPSTYLPLLTYNLLHSSAMHFGGNAVIMLFACAAVEKYAGLKATLFIWLAGGIMAGITHLLILPDASKALVGSSGAIAAMFGAAFVISWHWALPVRLWHGRRKLFSIPLPVVMTIWLGFQTYGFIKLAPRLEEVAVVATWVHLAGFAFGVVAAIALCLHEPQRAAQPCASHVLPTGD